MKIVCIENNYAQGNIAIPATFDIKRDLSFRIKADSTLLKNGKPFFIPTFTDNCVFRPGLAVRISRLGKTISRRFAYRYYDAVTVALEFVAEDMRQNLSSEGVSADLSTNLDGSMAIGEFIPLAGNENCANAGFSVRVGTGCYEETRQNMQYGIDDIIACLSEIMSLRQGDLLFLASSHDAARAVVNQHVVGCIGKQQVLEFNIK